jgi:hypothetical protein
MAWKLPFSEKAITDVYGSMTPFRKKNNMQPHSGTDFAPAGSNKGNTAIPAVANGTIKLIQWSNILGWVIVQSALDSSKKVWYIGYCHVKCGTHGLNCKGPNVQGCKSPIKMKLNDKLEQGETVAIMGNTGTASSGVHLHLTSSNQLKGVFWATADKVDIVKLAKKNAAPKAAPKAAPVAAPAPTSET